MSNPIAEEKFDIKHNHKKYPPGDTRRLTDISEALTKLGKEHMEKGTALGVALECQDVPAMEGEKLVKAHTKQRLTTLKEKYVQTIETASHGETGMIRKEVAIQELKDLIEEELQ